MLTTVNAARRRLKPILPPFGHKLLRVAWYGAVLPPIRALSSLRERTGASYTDAPPGHILAQYSLNDAAQYRRVGEKKFAMISGKLRDEGITVPKDARILDFGCGAAGTLDAFSRHLPKAEPYGCDLKADVTGWVKKYRPRLTVTKTKPAPPLPADYKDFDLVYAISVWTHMPETACSEWLEHMHSRIKKGGILFMTVAEPSTDFARRHGFDPKELAERTRKNGGCLYDAGTDMSYIQREWVEREIKGRFKLRYFGPVDGHVQYAVILERI